jgi:hypothetical protein
MAIAINGITPATGVITGGTVHHIAGVDLDDVTTITIKGTTVPTDQWSALSTSLIKLTTPPFSATGAGDVVLGPGAVTLAGGFTVTAATASDEQLVSTLARKWQLDVNTGTSDAPVWVQVRAISELTPSSDPTMEDDSDYDSNGWGSSVKTMQTWSLAATLGRKVGVESANHDPGQEFIRSRDPEFGSASTVQVRWYDRQGGPEAYTGYASVQWSEAGGSASALSTASLTLSGQGKRTSIVNPAA